MYFKMALANVKKSFKDYMIYFLTLTFAVCIFYSFNSIASQRAMFELGSYKASYIDLMEQLINILSVFVAMILGSLILYGNNFLVKKRKKELGIYMTLGMSKKNISKILLLETLIIGVGALGVGLLLGSLTAQGLSLLTIKLFEMNMDAYVFTLSGTALVKTILYFGVIFFIVMCFNKTSVARYKLIDLLNAEKKNEVVKMRSKQGSVVVCIVGVTFCLVAYGMIQKVGLDIRSYGFWISILLGVVGTLGYFFGITGFVIALIEGNKKIYFKRLNLFSMKQMSSKMYTHVVSMTMICLMMFLTIAGLSTGLSMKNTLETSLESNTPYDATVMIYADEKERDLEKVLNHFGITFEGSETSAVYSEYGLDLRIGDLIETENKSQSKMRIYGVPISQFNEIMKLAGKEELQVESDEIIISSNATAYIDIAQQIIDEKQEILIEEKLYRIKNEKVVVESLETTGYSSNILTLIVPDEVIQNKIPSSYVMNINYGEGSRQESENKFGAFFSAYREGVYKGEKINYEENGFLIGETRQQIYEGNKGSTTMILFVGIYLGMVFMISSAALLALQQLAEASESVERYSVLKKIGASKQMIHKSIFIETLVYFMLPLSLAIVHAIVGISVANDFIRGYGKPDIGGASLITMTVLAIVYGGYFYTTYLGYKNIVEIE